MVTSIDAENALDRTKHTFLVKNLSKLYLEGRSPNLMKNIYKNNKQTNSPELTSYLKYIKNEWYFYTQAINNWNS